MNETHKPRICLSSNLFQDYIYILFSGNMNLAMEGETYTRLAEAGWLLLLPVLIAVTSLRPTSPACIW